MCEVPLFAECIGVAPKAHARTRILADDEICAIWTAYEQGHTYGDLLKLALLTGQRQDKVASMRWDDISIDGAWHVPQRWAREGCWGCLGSAHRGIGYHSSSPTVRV